MHDYQGMRQRYGKAVSRTIDSPILVFDYFQLSEVMVALLALLIFGLVVNSWSLMFLSQLVILGAGPYLRRRYPKGVFLHWPYAKLGMELPGIINPGRHRRFSD